MKIFKTTLICVLVAAILVGGGFALAQAASAPPSETNPFVKNYGVPPINQNEPFFDVVLPRIAANIKEYNTHSISPYYDKMPLANNPENFQGVGSTTYANINGKTVTAEAFYRVKNDSLGDPNNGMGLLVYQCIQYKRAHPEEDVKITFSSYRTSITASVCVLPESKYYGYMRSLYGTNYDEHGFVRISYMLVEAARMGIEVTLVNQLNSYSVKQYNPKTGKLESRAQINHEAYFTEAAKGACYNKYAPGKKVGEFLNSVTVDWPVGDNTSEMQHVKSATVSHYLATDGTEHGKSVYFGSANLDENNYIGANGNNSSQSGVIVSDHDELYRVTYNYMQLMTRYPGKDEMFELRKIINTMNNEQAALIRAGRGNEIPADEQIIYLGTENDPVFEMYFTPFGGGADQWDTEANPFCKYLDRFGKSTGYVELIWNEFGYGDCQIGNVMSKMLEQAYCGNPDPRNKIAIRVTGFNTDAIQKLQLGKEIGYRSIKDGTNIHSKDILMSYEENGVRHNVSLLTSCNFYMIAFNMRTNSLLVIHETEETGGNFYEVMGETYSYGMTNQELAVETPNVSLEVGESFKLEADYTGKGTLTWSSNKKSVATVGSDGTVVAKAPGSATITVTDGTHKYTVKVTVVACGDCAATQGLTCTIHEQLVFSQQLSKTPKTFQAVFTLTERELGGKTVTLLGNDDGYEPGMAITINASGNPVVMLRKAASTSVKEGYVFKDVNVATGKKVELTITFNPSKDKIVCFVDGVAKQSITKLPAWTEFEMKYPLVVGGDYLNGNATCFPGILERIALWSDTRVTAEIEEEYKSGLKTDDKNLLVAFDFAKCDQHATGDLTGKGMKLEEVILWQDKEDVEPVTDFDYSFAVIGDTQTMMEADPYAAKSIYDWLLANKDSHKIAYVLGMGDITDDSTDNEWYFATQFISQLNGKIPYSLVRGNHDDWDDFNRLLHNGFYEKTIAGMMVPGKIQLTDPKQPGLIPGTLPDGSQGLVTREEDVPEGGEVMGDLTNSYRYLTVGGTDYLIMTLDFAPNSKMLAWADSVIAAHPNHKVIITTHAYMYRDGTTIDKGDLYPPTHYTGYTDQQNGDDMWNKCFSKHKNVVLVLSGHDPWQHIMYRQDKGVNGNTVTQMLIDAQYVDRKIGSTAMVAMLYFSNNGKTLTVRYYSVAKDCYGSVASQFTLDLT